MAGTAFLNGSFAININVSAAINIVPPNNIPAKTAMIGTHMPTIIPIAPIISKLPVKILKNDGKQIV